MSKKHSRRRGRAPAAGLRKSRVAVAIAVALMCVVGVSLLAQVNSRRKSKGTSGGVSVASFAPANPSKEYVYAGGRLIATEEPQAQPIAYQGRHDGAGCNTIQGWALTVNSPTGAATTTKFDRDSNGNDQLAYSQQVSYNEISGASKTITSKSWFDGAWRVLRSGSGAGSSPASFDAVVSS